MRMLTILLLMLFTTSVCLAMDTPLEYIVKERNSLKEVNGEKNGDYLIQQKDDNALYVVHEGKKYYLPHDMVKILEYKAFSAKTLSPKEFNSIPYGEDEWLEVRLEQILSNRFTPQKNTTLPKSLQEGSLIKREGDYMVYILHHGKKYLVSDRKLAEERGYNLSDAKKLPSGIFDAILKGEDNWLNDYLLTKEPLPETPARERYYPSYGEVFSNGTNPYKEDQSGYNNPYPLSGDQLYGGEFRRFEQKIFDNVRSNILSPRELAERKMAEEEAELNRRYMEAQIGGGYQWEFAQQPESSYSNDYSQDYPTTEANTENLFNNDYSSDYSLTTTDVDIPLVENGGDMGNW